MDHPLRRLGRPALVGLADALQSGRLPLPYARSGLGKHLPEAELDAVLAVLRGLEQDGMKPRHIAQMLRLLAEERAAQQQLGDRVELVLSPPELDQVDARDTAVVVQDLFRRAQHRLLIVTFALDSREKAEALFGELALRMDAQPDLSVSLLVNIHRAYGDQTPAARLVRDFARRFRAQTWPGERLPEVYYDPRSVEEDGQKRAVLHAKCVVADERWSLLTSANLTEAAQERNIEAGILLEDVRFAKRVSRQFAQLVERGRLMLLPMSA